MDSSASANAGNAYPPSRRIPRQQADRYRSLGRGGRGHFGMRGVGAAGGGGARKSRGGRGGGMVGPWPPPPQLVVSWGLAGGRGHARTRGGAPNAAPLSAASPP